MLNPPGDVSIPFSAGLRPRQLFLYYEPSEVLLYVSIPFSAGLRPRRARRCAGLRRGGIVSIPFSAGLGPRRRLPAFTVAVSVPVSIPFSAGLRPRLMRSIRDQLVQKLQGFNPLFSGAKAASIAIVSIDVYCPSSTGFNPLFSGAKAASTELERRVVNGATEFQSPFQRG